MRRVAGVGLHDGPERLAVDMSEAQSEEQILLSQGRPLTATTSHEGLPRATPKTYIGLLTFFGGIGGFLFGYDTGVISGALPYLRDDLLQDFQGDITRLNWIQEVIVSSAVLGAAIGSALGGWFSDRVGRKKALLLGDLLFTAGAVLMGTAQNVEMLIAGRALVGLGVGLASVTVPVYIAESAPKEVRATLVTVNVLMITSGQFVAYLVDWMFTFVPGTWRWMLGIAAVPAVLQFVGLMFLPESPRWLAANGQLAAARLVLRKLQPAAAAEGDAAELVAAAEGAGKEKVAVWPLLRTPEVRAELSVGLGLQILQQVAGINTVMYYTPAILELAGVHDKRTALLVALGPAAVNAAGTVVGMWFIDRVGRRKLLLSSLAAVAVALGCLGLAFYVADSTSPLVNPAAPTTCPLAATGLDCSHCLRQGCGFCGPANNPSAAGFCLLPTPGKDQCLPADGVMLYSKGCPSPYTPLIIVGLMLYLAAFSPGLGPVPWAVNAEIYPLQLRGLASGAAATCNWLANALVSQTFLTLTQHLGGSGTFWLYGVLCLAGLVWVHHCLPETNGLRLEEVQELFALRVKRQTAGGSEHAPQLVLES